MNKKKICMIVAAAVLVVGGLLIGTVWAGKRSNRDKGADMASFTQTESLKKRDIKNSISLTGSIASTDEHSVSSDMKDAVIKEVSVSVGDYVKAGDTIVVFDSEDLEEELEDTKDSYEVDVLKENQTLKKAQDSVADAQSTYESQAAKLSDSTSDAESAYESAESAKSSAKSAYDKAKKTTESAKSEYEKLKEKKDSLKKDMDSAQKESQEKSKELEQAESACESAEAMLKYAKEDDADYDNLYQAYTESYAAYEKAKGEAEKASQKYEKAKNAYDAIEAAKKKYEEAKDAEKQAKSAYETASDESSKKLSEYNSAKTEQAETNEKNAKSITDSQSDLTVTSKEVENNLKTQKKQVQQAEEKLGECVITSPISGVITAINAEAGDTYTGESSLFTVQDMSGFLVEASVDEYDIADIQVGQEAVIKTDATGEEELSGVVTFVSPTPEESGNSNMGSSSSSASYQVQITLSDTNDRLRIGMTAKTSIILESVKDVFAVAYDCISTDKEGNSYVTVLSGEKGEEEQKQIYVETGMESDYYVEITSEELEENMRIVTPLAGTGQSGEEDSKADDGEGSMFPINLDGGGMPQGGNNGGQRPGGGMSGGGPGGGN